MTSSTPALSQFGGTPGWFDLNPDNGGQPQTSTRRVSFGSVFNESSGNGNGGEDQRGSVGMPQSQGIHGSSTTFNIGIKPKDPPFFHGRANEDVDTWIAKVGDFLYLTEANSRQQVAYAATLLLDAAADWWAALLRERYGRRLDTWAEFTVLLAKRFRSSIRVDRARADLRNIRQGQSENVRTYSTRFEALLAKLPSFDRDWVKTQFIWGLHACVAELFVIANPVDLHAAINHAEKIEMARSFAASGQQGQKQGNPNRGRGGFMRERGRFNAVTVQAQPVNSASNANMVNAGFQSGGQNSGGYNARPLAQNQCGRCRGYGHWAYQCPTLARGRGRGQMQGRQGGRGRGCRGGHNTGQVPSNVNAALQVSDAGAPGPSTQPGPGVAPVPSQQGN